MIHPGNFFKAKWRRPKHKGVSGNFSTLVIITGIVIGSYIMTGGGYPEIVSTYPADVMKGEPYAVQPKHSQEYGMTFRELRMRPLGRAKPTPIPSFGPTLPPIATPTPEPPVEACTNTALVFLVDASNSMNEPGTGGVSKLTNLKNALTEFAETLPPQTLFGLYTFSSPNGQEPQRRVLIAPMSQNGTRIGPALSQINPPPAAATHMRAGFEYVRQELSAAQQTYPDYNYNLIFISDGVPEQEGAPGGPGCLKEFTINNFCDEVRGRNFDKRHDPTDFWGPTFGQDIPELIKESNTNIYSIAINNATDTQVFPELEELMKRISSGAEFYSNSVGGGNLGDIYENIKDTACNES